MKNTIEQALQSQELKYQVLEDTTNRMVIRMGMGMPNSRFDVYIDVRPDAGQVLIFTVFPTLIPENQRVRVAEFITRANYGLIIGNFELDFGDGELRYKATYFYDDTFPASQTTFLKSLYTCFHMMDRYLPGVMAVTYANTLPIVAIQQAEKNNNPRDN